MVGGGDGGGDRESESYARVVGAGAVGNRTAERLGQLADQAWIDKRAAVLDYEQRRVGTSGGSDADPAAGLVVPDGVVDQVAGQVAEQCLVAGDWRVVMLRGDGEVHVVNRVGAIGKGAGGEPVQRDHAPMYGAVVLCAGKSKETFDQPVGLVESRPDLAGQRGDGRNRGPGLAGGHVQRGA